MIEESIALANVIPDGAVTVILDERGESLGSATFADHIRKWRDGGSPRRRLRHRRADGLADSLRDKAKLKLAFGAATWPHQLVRIMLLEQIYRAITILSGHPYHRGVNGLNRAIAVARSNAPEERRLKADKPDGAFVSTDPRRGPACAGGLCGSRLARGARCTRAGECPATSARGRRRPPQAARPGTRGRARRTEKRRSRTKSGCALEIGTRSARIAASSIRALIDTAATVSDVEQPAERERSALKPLRGRRNRILRRSLDDRRAVIAEVLAALQRDRPPAAAGRDGASRRRAAIGAHRDAARRRAAGDARRGAASRQPISPNSCAPHRDRARKSRS